MGQGKSKHHHSSSLSSSAPPAGGDVADSSSRKKKRASVAADGSQQDKSSGGEWSRRRADDLFNKYQGEDGVIGPDQMGRLCDDIGVSPEDVCMLVLSYHLNARSMGFFTREEWLGGMQRLRVETLAQLKACVRSLGAQLSDMETFRKVYRFAFLWSREKDCKVIDLETVDGLLALLMQERSGHTIVFREFLKEQTSYKGMNLDQWVSFLEFTQVVGKDYAGYDESSAWPVMLDEFVQWATSKNKSSVGVNN